MVEHSFLFLKIRLDEEIVKVEDRLREQLEREREES
jgi:hypothetical protein